MIKKAHGKEVLWIIRDKYNGTIDPKHLTPDINRLKKGEPLDYIIGWKPFLGCKIDLSFKPLIPRPETEFWVEKTILEIGKNKIKALDIFAGSGCVGVAVLKNCPNAKVDFAEINNKLIKQIKINLKVNKIKKERYKVIPSNIFGSIKEKYDFILANPPYIPTPHIKKIQKSVLAYESRLALFGGKNGLSLITPFLKQAKKHLNTGGQIWFEFDPSQKQSIEKIIKKNDYSSWSFRKDQHRRWRFVTIFLEQ